MWKIGNLFEIGGEMTFEWTIGDCFQLFRESEIDTRSVSSDYYFNGTCWEMSIFLNGETEHKSEGWIGLYLVRMSTGSPVTVDFSFGLKAVDGNTICEKSGSHKFQLCKSGQGYGYAKFISKSKLMEKKPELSLSDELTIVCTLKSHEKNTESYFSRLQDVSNNLKEIYKEGKHTDFTLKVGSESIHAHRMILETRSPVFAAMLNHDTQEKQTGEVVIKDFDKSTMDDIIGYIYSEDIGNLTTEKALSLYAAADTYDIKHLREMCVQFLLNNISDEWVCEIIKFSDSYNEEEVGCRAREYFKEKAEEILDSNKWKSFIRENPQMGIDLLSSIVKLSLRK